MKLWDLFTTEGEDSGVVVDGGTAHIQRSHPFDRVDGSESYWAGYADGRTDREDSATYWDAPAFPSRGMTAKELADFQKAFTTHARGRLLGVGAEQYADQAGQRFEGYSVNRLLGELQDELADVVNYAAMIAIQLQRIKEKYSAQR